jgi:hypothetical protein
MQKVEGFPAALPHLPDQIFIRQRHQAQLLLLIGGSANAFLLPFALWQRKCFFTAICAMAAQMLFYCHLRCGSANASYYHSLAADQCSGY